MRSSRRCAPYMGVLAPLTRRLTRKEKGRALGMSPTDMGQNPRQTGSGEAKRRSGYPTRQKAHFSVLALPYEDSLPEGTDAAGQLLSTMGPPFGFRPAQAASSVPAPWDPRPESGAMGGGGSQKR